MAMQDKDEPAPPPPAALGEILRRAYDDDYHADLRFELIRRMSRSTTARLLGK